MERARVLIVGGGIAGVSTAWHLVLRDVDGVLLLEREQTLGVHSSGRNAAILRTLTERAHITELALESARFLAAPPAGFADAPLVDPCGLVLVLGEPPPPGLEAWRRRKAPGTVRELSREELRALVPDFAGEAPRTLSVRDEGRLDIAALLDGFARGARAGGAELRTGAAVRELVVEDGRVRGALLESGARVEADAVLLAPGGWAGQLARRAGSPVVMRAMRRHLVVTAPDASIDPRRPVFWSDRDGYYARPESGGMLLCPCDQSEVSPDACVVDEAATELVAEKTARLFPALASAGLAHAWAGTRTFAPDGEFVIGPDPAVAGLYWAAALGGHGMTCAPAVGRLAAAHLVGEADGDPLADGCAPARLARELRGAR